MSEQYEQFGKQWEAELMKGSKRYLIEWIRRLAKENAELKSKAGGST
jgi:hypothetical protein